MRGKLWRNGITSFETGITPAYAGKTKSSSVKLFAHRDHPRRCGENYLFRFYMTPSEGSPPRMRGKRGGVRGGKGYT